MLVLKIFAIGWAVLIVAIVLNILATKLGIKTWYEFLKEPSSTSIVSVAWLFVVYPLVLGLAAYVMHRMLP